MEEDIGDGEDQPAGVSWEAALVPELWREDRSRVS